MNNEFIHFEKISRKTWQNLHRKTTPPVPPSVNAGRIITG